MIKNPDELTPVNVERSFKKERWEQCSEDEIFGETDLRRERQNRENDPCHNQADAIREANSPSQHRDDCSNQKQHRYGLKIKIHTFSLARAPLLCRSGAFDKDLKYFCGCVLTTSEGLAGRRIARSRAG